MLLDVGTLFYFFEKERGVKMQDFKKLYFYLFGRVADVIEEYEGVLEHKELIGKLIAIEQETEEMYMDMPSFEDEVTED